MNQRVSAHHDQHLPSTTATHAHTPVQRICSVTLYQDAHQTPGSVPAVPWRGLACGGTYACAATSAVGGSSDSDDATSAPLTSYMSDESEWQDSASDDSGAMSVSSAGSAGPVLRHIHRALTEPEADLPAVTPAPAAQRVTAPQAPPSRQPASQPPAAPPSAGGIPLVHRLPITSPSVHAAAVDARAGSPGAASPLGADPFATAAAAAAEPPPQRAGSPATTPEAGAAAQPAAKLGRGPSSRGAGERTHSGSFVPPAERTRSGSFVPPDRPDSSAPPGSRLHASESLRSNNSLQSAISALRVAPGPSGAVAEDSPARADGSPSMPSYCDECCEGATFKVRSQPRMPAATHDRTKHTQPHSRGHERCPSLSGPWANDPHTASAICALSLLFVARPPVHRSGT